MKLVVDTGVFSASLSSRRSATISPLVATLSGNQIFLAAVTVAELRFGALVAGWGAARRQRLEEGIESTTVVPVTNALLTDVAELRFACRQVGHPLADRIHANDLWVAASALHIGAALVTADGVFTDAPGLTLAR
ncbi:MAG: PIN domain-containing protein [Actinomycetota bacterium]|mgnify:CR=1 FL=1